MNHEPEIIRARFVEAAFTERFLPSARFPSSSGYWPVIFHDAEDQAGWDDAAKLDNAERSKGRASMGAISRHQECLDWTATIIMDEKRRHIVWAWAFCKANGWDFGARCVKKGWARPTAYRRLAASIDAISVHFDISNAVVRLPEQKWLRQEEHLVIETSLRSVHSDESPTPTNHPPYRTEPSRHLLKTKQAVADFEKTLERRNARMRKIQGWRNEGAA